MINSELLTTEQIRHATNPANGEPNPPVPVSGAHHLQSAIEAARQKRSGNGPGSQLRNEELL